jgi:hypothetical protein
MTRTTAENSSRPVHAPLQDRSPDNPESDHTETKSAKAVHGTAGVPSKQDVWAALEAIQPGDYQILVTFAQLKLRLAHLETDLAKDIVQRSLLLPAVGTVRPGMGRHPRPDDVAGRAEFLNYLHGIISSLVDGERNLVERRYLHVNWVEEMSADLLDGRCSDAAGFTALAFADLLEEFDRRLVQQAKPHLRRPLTAWRGQRFDCEQIPLAGAHRRLRSDLQRLARKIFSDLSSLTSSANR